MSLGRLVLPIFCLCLNWQSPAFADFVEVKNLDMFNRIPKPNPDEKNWDLFLQNAKPGGELSAGVEQLIESLHVYAFIDGKPGPKRAPFLDDFVYETLMTRDVRNVSAQINVPHLASKIELDESANSIRATLNPKATFADGEPVQARHVVSSWPINRNSLWTSMFEDLYGGEVQIRELSNQQVLIQFPKLSPKLFRRAAFILLSDLKIVKPFPKNGSKNDKELKLEYMGTGAYQITSATRYKVRLQRNPNYWGNQQSSARGQFNFSAIVINAYGDPVIKRLGMTRGELNFYREINPAYLAWMDKKAIEKGFVKQTQNINYSLPDGSARALFMNFDREHIRRLNFRKALALAWNPEIPERMFGDLRDTPTSPGVFSPLSPKGLPSEHVKLLINNIDDPLRDEALKPYDQMGWEAIAQIKGSRKRLKAASELLKADGFTVQSFDGDIRLLWQNRPVNLKLVTITDRPDNRRVQLFAEILKKLGINVEIRMFPDTATAFKVLASGDYDFFPAGISIHRTFETLNINYLRQSLHSSSVKSGLNRSHFRSKAVDVALEQLSSMDAGDPEYASYVEVLMRSLSSYVPFILLGEPVVSFVYTDPNLRLYPEIQAEDVHKNALSIRTGYFEAR